MPALDSGLVASRTSGSRLNAVTVSSIGCANLSSVSFAPFGAASTTGFVPLACEGKRAVSRSVARWLSVPGQREVVVDVRADAPRGERQGREHHEPDPEDEPSMAHAELPEAVQDRGHRTPLSNTTATPSAFTQTPTARPYTFA